MGDGFVHASGLFFYHATDVLPNLINLAINTALMSAQASFMLWEHERNPKAGLMLCQHKKAEHEQNVSRGTAAASNVAFNNHSFNLWF